MIAIRGATTIEENEQEAVFDSTILLLDQIIRSNRLEKDRITSIFFSCTRDITAAYPAKAARMIGLNETALMCFQEMHVEESLTMCIRVCLFYDGDLDKNRLKHVYLNKASSLRPDWSIGS